LLPNAYRTASDGTNRQDDRVTVLTGQGVDGVLAEARRGIQRYTPRETVVARLRGALVVDTRTETQRAEAGELPGAIVIDRTVLEWRLDPASDARIAEATGYDIEVVVVCRQGFSSSLAAESLRRVGLHRATDMVGGVEAWQEAGLLLHRGPADVRR
jgi:rhodanese-related sulfurtransferase